tara:strand:+ start:668 stop:862 length:195 start_codon:yes stop_codon:yes gene_type:complete
MVFGKDGFFKNAYMGVGEGRVWPANESWYANDKYSMIFFQKGKFLYVATGSTGTDSVSADCDKF